MHEWKLFEVEIHVVTGTKCANSNMLLKSTCLLVGQLYFDSFFLMLCVWLHLFFYFVQNIEKSLINKTYFAVVCFTAISVKKFGWL